MAPRLQPCNQRIRVHPLDWLFAGGIDRCGKHDVSIVERALKLVHQVAQPGVAMRLDHRDHPALRRFARGGQNGADFDRVMRIIIDDGGSRHFTDAGKAAADPAELGKA